MSVELLGKLTTRQREILALMMEADLSVAAIARRLHLAESTVKTHIANIYAKLEVRTRAGVVRLVAESDSGAPEVVQAVAQAYVLRPGSVVLTPPEVYGLLKACEAHMGGHVTGVPRALAGYVGRVSGYAAADYRIVLICLGFEVMGLLKCDGPIVQISPAQTYEQALANEFRRLAVDAVSRRERLRQLRDFRAAVELLPAELRKQWQSLTTIG